LNSGVHTCKADAVPLEPHLQSILLWLFWRWGLSKHLLGWAGTGIMSISASQVDGMTGMSPTDKIINIMDGIWNVTFTYAYSSGSRTRQNFTNVSHHHHHEGRS
jgi:hypothetical protein